MQRVYRVSVLDNFLSKISIHILWPKFSTIFDLHISNIQKCSPKHFKFYNQTGMHGPTTLRCFQLLYGLVKLQEQLTDGKNIQKLSETDRENVNQVQEIVSMGN